MYSNNQGDLPRSSIDKDVHHEHTKRRGTKKYLRESCYHRIECTAATFLATFMWRRLLNSATLATPTHRGPERVFDGTSTEVMPWMVNNWRVKIIEKEIYNVRDP